MSLKFSVFEEIDGEGTGDSANGWEGRQIPPTKRTRSLYKHSTSHNQYSSITPQSQKCVHCFTTASQCKLIQKYLFFGALESNRGVILCFGHIVILVLKFAAFLADKGWIYFRFQRKSKLKCLKTTFPNNKQILVP